jgi:hypothetical protein
LGAAVCIVVAGAAAAGVDAVPGAAAAEVADRMDPAGGPEWLVLDPPPHAATPSASETATAARLTAGIVPSPS